MSSPTLDLENEDRRSLYDIEKSRLGDKVIVVHRIIFIGCLKKDTEKRLAVAGKIQEDIANLRDKDDENLSGLMLMYTKHFIQILECSEKVFVSIARYLSSTCESSLIEKAKIISISHNISQRLFKVIHVSALDIQAQNLHSYQPSESIDKLIVDIVGQILKLGSQIVRLPKPEIVKCLENLHREHSDLLPQQAILNYLLKEDDGSLISMEEFIALHDQPFDVTFDSGLGETLDGTSVLQCILTKPKSVLQSRYYVHFLTNTLENDMNPLIIPDLVWPLAPRLYPNNYMT